MFKGYMPTNGKRPTEKTKGRTEFYKLNDVENLKSYGGVLSDDVILIDIDDFEESEILYKIINELNISCNVIKTSRGKHFYFKNTTVKVNSIHRLSAIGLTVDVKLGSKNSVVPLKIDGVEREWLRKVDELEDLPKWLQVVKTTIEFKKLNEGDGRNQTLFNYILTLQKHRFDKNDIRETIKLINKYILKTPLNESEIETILRDEAFEKECFYNDRGSLMHDAFAEFLRNNENIININNQLHIYDEGIYKNDIALIEKSMIKHISILTKSKRTEVLEYLKLIVEEKKLSDTNIIVVKNGLYNIFDGSLSDFNIHYVSKNKIPVAYNPKAYDTNVDYVLNKISCKDHQLRSLIEEMIGYTLLRRNELGKCFILTGCGSNGKSTLLDMIKELLGSENVSAIALEELNTRFKPAEIYGKMANIGDDISNKYIDDNAVFKKLVTGDSVNVERKGGHPFDFNNYAKLIFSANELPRINDTSDGLMRRLLIVPFKARFSRNDPDYDPYIKDKLITNNAKEYLLLLGIKGLKRILENKGFTNVKAAIDELKEYELKNNPILEFMEDTKIDHEETKTIYLQYSTWCCENGLKALSNIQFGKELSKYGFIRKQVRLDGKQIRMYMKEVNK